MKDHREHRDLFRTLLAFTRISAKLGDGSAHDARLLRKRELLRQQAERQGFAISDQQQQRLCDRLQH